MNIFYNREGIGDTLLINLKPVDKENMTFERKDNIVRIFNPETNETYGYNILHVRDKIAFETKRSVVKLTPELLDKINALLKDVGFTEELTADFSPKFVVGYVEEKEKHPNADKLSVCKVNIGTKTLQIVCGAPNVDRGQKVVVARIGAVMPNGQVIQPSELRGVPSEGMICSARELQLPNAPAKKGILVLDDPHEVGSEFTF